MYQVIDAKRIKRRIWASKERENGEIRLIYFLRTVLRLIPPPYLLKTAPIFSPVKVTKYKIPYHWCQSKKAIRRDLKYGGISILGLFGRGRSSIVGFSGLKIW
jgi:hypothetical protein